MFAVVALARAFAAYNLGLPLTLRSAVYPLPGEAVWGRFGHGIDILAVFATLFGLATSLGLGAEQTAAGLAHLFGVPATDITKVLLIAGITGMALASVVAGLDRGVKRLSQVNLLLALLLLAVDHVLLGVVALVVSLRRPVHRPRLARPYDARARRLHAGRAGAGAAGRGARHRLPDRPGAVGDVLQRLEGAACGPANLTIRCRAHRRVTSSDSER